MALAVVMSMILSSLSMLAPQASSDPEVRDNGDNTLSVVWDMNDPEDYKLYNTTVSGGLGKLTASDGVAGENSTAQYLLGSSGNADFTSVPDAITIADTSTPVQTITLQPGPEGKDSYLDEWFPYWTPADGSDIVIDGQYDPVPSSSKRNHLIMQFDLATVPYGAVVKDATLFLYLEQGKGAALKYTVHAVEAEWNESEVSWSTRDAMLGWSRVGGDYSQEPFFWGTLDNVVGWKSFNLTRLVDLWLRRTIPNFGFMMVPEKTAADTSKTFTDCEAKVKPENRPKLVINYTLGEAGAWYKSVPLGPGTNSTFMSASWSAGLCSRASDEFEGGTLSTKWLWKVNPAGSGGSVALDPDGWLNVTGSTSTYLPDATNQSNFMYQPVAGYFALETSLRVNQSSSTMGSGLLVMSDRCTWISLYLAGGPGSELVVAKASKGGLIASVGSVSWPGNAAHLRILRYPAGYQFLASLDGSGWSTIGTYSPTYDLTLNVLTGVFMFSGSPTLQPRARFDCVRFTPTVDAASLSMSVRTGNSTSEADPSWSSWKGPLSPSSGAALGSTGRYVQYRIALSTAYRWLMPVFYGFECRYRSHTSNGTIVTGEMAPEALEVWESMTVVQNVSVGSIVYSYSSDRGNSWTELGRGDSFVLSLTTRSLLVKADLYTPDNAVTPSIDRIELVYRATHAGFYVQVPAEVAAGQPFSMYVEPKDVYNHTASWRGTVTLHAVDSSGVANASSELAVTQAAMPSDGRLWINDQRYGVAETIRVLVSGGGLTALSSEIRVVPGPPSFIRIEPDVDSLLPNTTTVFTATLYDALENPIMGAQFSWQADAWLGTINRTTGASVSLTTVQGEATGRLNVSSAGVRASLLISVSASGHPPRISQSLPTQTKVEDFGTWTLDLTPYVSDNEDDFSQLRWYALNESIIKISGENRTGNMIITFTTIKDVSGVNILDVCVVDSDRQSAKSKLTVEILPVNDPPRIEPIAPIYVRFDESYQYNLEFYVTDPDTPRTGLTVSVDAQSSAYVQVSNLWLTFLYPESLNGTEQTVIVSVSDGEYTVSTAILVYISNNHVPRTLGPLPDQLMKQGEIKRGAFDLDDYFYDPDGITMYYTNRNTHVGVVIQSNHTVDFYAPTDWAGEEYILFIATDALGARAESALRMKVLAVNHPPVIYGVPDLIIRHDLRYDFDLRPYISDQDTDVGDLIVTADDQHAWTLGTLLSLLYPVTMLHLTVPLTITVSDGLLSDWWVINVTVSTDYPPELIVAAPDHSFLEDQPRPYPVLGHVDDFFTDRDDEQLTYSVFLSVPNVLAEVNDTGDGWSVMFVPEKDWHGLASVTLRAKDPRGALVETTITLAVISVPDAPVLDLPDTFETTEGSRSIIDAGGLVSDPDSGPTDLRWVVESPYSEHIRVYSGMVMFEFPRGFLAEGEKSRTFTITVMVFDQDNLMSADNVTVTVTSIPPTPQGGDMFWLSLGILAIGAVAATASGLAFSRRRKPFVLHDMMLIHNDGFLIGRYATPKEGEIDDQVLSAMLTAVLNFVDDSMAGGRETLKVFGFRNYHVVVERGHKAFAALAYEGDLPEGIEEAVNGFLATVERVYKKKLENWSGDIENDFAGIELLIRSFVNDHSRKKRVGSGTVWTTRSKERKVKPRRVSVPQSYTESEGAKVEEAHVAEGPKEGLVR